MWKGLPAYDQQKGGVCCTAPDQAAYWALHVAQEEG